MADPQGRVLIVEDNKVNRLLLSRHVELLGHRVAIAENGRVAMNMLADAPYDLLLLDIEMPEMNGFEVLEAIKSQADLRDLSVLVTSSIEGLDNIVRCIELGAEDYLPKPVNKVLLGARVSSCLEKKRLRDEQKRLLERFATSEVAQELQETGFAIGGKRAHASVLFCDIRDFTALSEHLSPEATIELLNAYYTLMFEAVRSHGGIVSLMLGDGLMALFGVPHELENSAQSAVNAGREMLSMIEMLNQDRAAQGEADIRLGIGIATGEVVAGYAGTDERATYTCVGSTVNLAARLEAQTKVMGCQTLIDHNSKAQLTDCSGVQTYTDIELKGFSESLTIFSV
ncbi:MAG: adenylate/guanylate cyclase domain-containing response regulator [Pseudomonadota bacterium]